jgi:hypothetical protein
MSLIAAFFVGIAFACVVFIAATYILDRLYGPAGRDD